MTNGDSQITNLDCNLLRSEWEYTEREKLNMTDGKKAFMNFIICSSVHLCIFSISCVTKYVSFIYFILSKAKTGWMSPVGRFV